MPIALILLLVLAAAWPAASQEQAPSVRVQTRRVTISLTFTGQQVFLFGRIMPGTQKVLAVMEGPSAGTVRLMEQGRVGLFWLGVRQYKLTRVPGVYLVNASGPFCRDLLTCTNPVQPAVWNPSPAPTRFQVGLEAIRARAHLESLSGDLSREETERVFEGYWQLQARRELYALRDNAIRLGRDGVFYHRFALPTQAPEGKYRITTYFLDAEGLLGSAENELFVRKSGFLAWLTRLAEREAFSYGVFAVFIAVTAGWLAGTIFRRRGSH